MKKRKKENGKKGKRKGERKIGKEGRRNVKRKGESWQREKKGGEGENLGKGERREVWKDIGSENIIRERDRDRRGKVGKGKVGMVRGRLRRKGEDWEGKWRIEREKVRFRGNEEGWEWKRNIGNYGRDREGKYKGMVRGK